jgi:hypothetical protein
VRTWLDIALSVQLVSDIALFIGFEQDAVLVVVVALGRRKEGDGKDVYQLAQKLVQKFQLKQFLEDEDIEE